MPPPRYLPQQTFTEASSGGGRRVRLTGDVAYWPGPGCSPQRSVMSAIRAEPDIRRQGRYRPLASTVARILLVRAPRERPISCARCRLRADAGARRMYRSSAPPRHDRRPAAFMIWSQIHNDPCCVDPIRTSRSSDRVPESGRAGPWRYLEARALQESRKPVPSPGLWLFARRRD
jgi:hypothetical protein